MTLLNFQLQALQYPHSVDLTNTELVRKLVIWLENQKIREYKIGDRKALSDVQSPSWDAAFKKYLQDLECPVPPGDMTAALHWLVAFAVNLEYEDNADRIAAVSSQPPAAAAAAPGPGSGKHPGPSGAKGGGQDHHCFTDLQDPAVVAAVLQLIKAAQVEMPEDSGSGSSDATSPSSAIVDYLLAAAQRCVCEVGPALRTGVWSRGKPPRQALASVPLGFGLEGEALATAAAALRLLYIQDLRRLQSQIDHAIVEMQEYTANPKTDSSLGKVGR
ncbi:hypothetical protein Vretimale_16607 [Volvox reticuliferus]|uniref:Uncharacterized protein n=1 Tax=Volvox reticuliferus TaxID=1737510 RepID=A0A8J4LWY9_9CHLO|nr:hypothetical protein Vretifemale_17512 [Volvox reticuliferus]GIM13511.1 hypothetical protein Vretimale_16607 [Volvox reticuliferus]